jgi:hypothetical protein
MFSCRTRGFCPSCHSKRLEECGEWIREELLLDVHHHPQDAKVRYYGLYANAHRGKVRKSEEGAGKWVIIEQEEAKIRRRGWAEMIRKVYEVDPLRCPACGGRMRIIAFLTDYAVVDRIINHLKLTFIADKPPPPHLVYQEFLVAAEPSAEYFS